MKRAVDAGTVRMLATALAVYAAFGHRVTPDTSHPLQSQVPTGWELTGRVVDAGSGKTVPTAVVTVVALDAADAFRESAITGPDGNFEFRGLRSGVYVVTARRDGYVQATHGQLWPGGPGASLVLGNRKPRPIDIRLWRLAFLEGRLLDDRSEPLVAATVEAFRHEWRGGRLVLAPAAADNTDDRGIYRFPALLPGDYLVGVRSVRMTYYAQAAAPNLDLLPGAMIRFGHATVQQSNNLPLSASSGGAALTVFPTMFYPQAAIASEASILTLTSGEQEVLAEMHLVSAKGVLVSGIVRQSDGALASGTQIVLVPRGLGELATDNGFEVARTTTNGEGRFWLYGVPAGVYTLRAVRIPSPRPVTKAMEVELAILYTRYGDKLPPGTSRLRPSDLPTLWGETTLHVADQPVEADVEIHQASRLSGSIVFQGKTRRPSSELIRKIRLNVGPADTPVNGQLLPERVADDGTFVTTGTLPGRYILTITGEPPGWTLHSIMSGGKDYADTPLSVNGSIDGISVVLTDEPAAGLDVRVSAKRDGPSGLVVLAFPATRAQWAWLIQVSRRIGAAVTDEEGTCSIRGLAPGDYVVVALEGLTGPVWQSPGFLERAVAGATRVSVRPGEVSTMNLTTILRIGSEP